MKNYYDILRISPNVSHILVREAYLSLKSRMKDDLELVLELDRAYTVLSDPVKRSAYDNELMSTKGSVLANSREALDNLRLDSQEKIREAIVEGQESLGGLGLNNEEEIKAAIAKKQELLNDLRLGREKRTKQDELPLPAHEEEVRSEPVQQTSADGEDHVDGKFQNEIGRGTYVLKNNTHKKDYGAARLVGSLISGIGWILIACGFVALALIIIIMIVGKANLNLLMVIPLGAIILGLLDVASGQLVRATADIANNTAELLALEKAKSAQDGKERLKGEKGETLRETLI